MKCMRWAGFSADIICKSWSKVYDWNIKHCSVKPWHHCTVKLFEVTVADHANPLHRMDLKTHGPRYPHRMDDTHMRRLQRQMSLSPHLSHCPAHLSHSVCLSLGSWWGGIIPKHVSLEHVSQLSVLWVHLKDPSRRVKRPNRVCPVHLRFLYTPHLASHWSWEAGRKKLCKARFLVLRRTVSVASML